MEVKINRTSFLRGHRNTGENSSSQFNYKIRCCGLWKKYLQLYLLKNSFYFFQAFANPEDFMQSKKPLAERKAPLHATVERIRRWVVIYILYIVRSPK